MIYAQIDKAEKFESYLSFITSDCEKQCFYTKMFENIIKEELGYEHNEDAINTSFDTPEILRCLASMGFTPVSETFYYLDK